MSTHVPLSAREKEVADLIMDGNTSKEAARILNISYRTVEVHRTGIMNKLGARNFIEATRMLMEEQHENEMRLLSQRPRTHIGQTPGSVVLLPAARG